MIFASKALLAQNEAPVSMLWIIFAYFFITIGELWLSPVGLSMTTQIAPEKIKGQTMGLWFIAVALGNVVAGLYGGEVRADNLANLPSIFSQLNLYSLWCGKCFDYFVFYAKSQKYQNLRREYESPQTTLRATQSLNERSSN